MEGACHAQHLAGCCGAVSAAQSNAIHFSYLQGVSAKKLKSEAEGEVGRGREGKAWSVGRGGRGKSFVRVAK